MRSTVGKKEKWAIFARLGFSSANCTSTKNLWEIRAAASVDPNGSGLLVSRPPATQRLAARNLNEMRIHRPRIYWFCLLAYLWSATGMANMALVTALLDNHPSAPVVVMTGQQDEVIIHHLGHRDVHEPTVVDTQDDAGLRAGDTRHLHSDHVLKLDADLGGNGPVSKHSKLFDPLPAKLLGMAPRLIFTNALAVRDFFPTRSPIRNSAVAVVQLTRLRI